MSDEETKTVTPLDKVLKGEALTAEESSEVGELIARLNKEIPEAKKKFNDEIDLIISLQDKKKAPLFREVQKYHRKGAELNTLKLHAERQLASATKQYETVSAVMEGLLSNAYGLLMKINDTWNQNTGDYQRFVFTLTKANVFEELTELEKKLTKKEDVVENAESEETKPDPC